MPEFSWDPSNKHLWFTENRLPPSSRVGFPLDLMKQLTLTKQLLEHPPTPDVGHLLVLDAGLPVQQRTRILVNLANVGYIDGHVEWRAQNDLGQTDPTYKGKRQMYLGSSRYYF